MDLSEDDRAWFTSEAVKLTIDAESTLDGLKKLLSHDYSPNHRLRELSEAITNKAEERRRERDRDKSRDEEGRDEGGHDRDKSRDEEGRDEGGEVTVKETTVMVPTIFKSADQIESLVAELHKLRSQIGKKVRIRIIWKEID